MRRRHNPEVPKWLLAVIGLGAVGGAIYWWRNREKTNAQALALALQQSQQRTASAGPYTPVTPEDAFANRFLPKDPRIPLTKEQIDEVARQHEIFRARTAESYANTGAGHF